MRFDYLYPYYLLRAEIQKMVFRSAKQRQLRRKFLRAFYEKKKRNSKTAFLIMTPEHENIGDHAIAYAETKLLEALGVDYVEITGKQLEELRNYHLLGILDGKPIFLQGGGYLGTLWKESEILFRQILKANPNARIILFPNTIYYEPNAEGQAFFENSVIHYNNHKSLYLYAREKISFEHMYRYYKNVKLIPDIVLSLNKCTQGQTRSGCVVCLRNDCERTRTAEEETIIYQQARELFRDQVATSDMVASECIPIEKREAVLKDKFAEFSGAELVITDRLHGMIFCAITGTPCIVLDSKSPKLRGCYEWIKDLEYIRFIEDASQIAKTYRQIPKKRFHYDERRFEKEYQELANDILSIFSKGEKPWLK